MKRLTLAGACLMAALTGFGAAPKPIAMKVLPADWNRDWNGGVCRMTSFSDAPIPMCIFFNANVRKLKEPWVEFDVPEGLEIRDAYCPNPGCYGREKALCGACAFRGNAPTGEKCAFHGNAPTGECAFRGNAPTGECALGGETCRFVRPRALSQKRSPSFSVTSGLSLNVVFGPKGGDAIDRTFHIAIRVGDGERVDGERNVELVMRPLPKDRVTKDVFPAFSWHSVDRYYSDDAAFVSSLAAYEAAGLISFCCYERSCADFPRLRELVKILRARPLPYRFATGLDNMWSLSACGLTKAELEQMGGRLSTVVAGNRKKAERRAAYICPEFFTTAEGEKLRRHLAEKMLPERFAAANLQPGDWVTLDMEPLQPDCFCHCETCHKAFARYAKLDHVPTAEEIKKSHLREWQEFRVCHSTKSYQMVERLVHALRPDVKIMDYDYIHDYAEAQPHEKFFRTRDEFIRNCSKDTSAVDPWIDGHLTSYYHLHDRKAFLAMGNNVRTLRKPYWPMAGLSGIAEWQSPKEVRNPDQIRMFVLAAFVNGCSGFAFYTGCCYDGEMLLAMMEAQKQLAPYRHLPWGRKPGKTKVESGDKELAYASVCGQDGGEVIALFNYNSKKAVTARVCGAAYEIAPQGVKFMEVKK